MKVRGERECRECGVRWSYYKTGSVECPDCGSLRSVGVDDRTAHTDAPATLDLSAHRARFGDARGTLPEEGVDDLKDDLREYARRRGFIRGGELLPLDDTYLAARELLEAVDLYDRLRDPTDRDRESLALLAGADDGDRPATKAVPDSREARGDGGGPSGRRVPDRSDPRVPRRACWGRYGRGGRRERNRVRLRHR